MCNFFSFLADEKHNFYHFSHAQRLSKVKFSDGKTPFYDSHTSIAEYYGIKEDNCNKYEYNPFTDELTLDYQNMEENEAEVLSFVHSINWYDFFGNLEEIRTFFADLKDIPYMQNNPDFDLTGCKVFDTRKDAEEAAWDAAITAARNAAWFAANDAAEGAANNAAMDAGYLFSWDSAWSAAENAGRFATRGVTGIGAYYVAEDIALYAVTHYLCANLPIPQEHIDYINKLYAIWQNGYGVLGDINGVFHVYRSL